MLVYMPRNPFTPSSSHDENPFDMQITLSKEKALEAFRFWLTERKNNNSSTSVKRDAIGISEHSFSEHHLWICYDVRRLDLIGLHISKNCNNLEALDFLEEILSKCINVPSIITENQPYFDWAITKLNLHSSVTRNKSQIKQICKNQ